LSHATPALHTSFSFSAHFFELVANTRRTDGGARRVMRAVGWPHNGATGIQTLGVWWQFIEYHSSEWNMFTVH